MHLFPVSLPQGGFAKCYLFTEATNEENYAGKVVAKSSLKKERAKQKVRSITVLDVYPPQCAEFGRKRGRSRALGGTQQERVVAVPNA